MKSILVSENKMYITSFGKGNSAVLEYEVDNNDYNQTQLSSKGSSNIELRDVNEVNITFSSKHGFGSGVEINTSNPTHRSGESSPVRWDMLGLKSELEKRFSAKLLMIIYISSLFTTFWILKDTCGVCNEYRLCAEQYARCKGFRKS